MQQKQIYLAGRVLLAEDNIDNQRLVTLYLKRMGLEVHIANNGKEALDKLASVNPDLILMDIQMPVMDGLTATRELRKSGYSGPIIALTASVMQEEQQECFIAGCNDICAKPIDQGDFMRVLAKHLDRGQAEIASGPPIISALLATEPDMADLIHEFVKKLPGMVKDVQTAFADGDFETFKKEVHTLKGTSGNFGYSEIFDIAKRIEFDIIANNRAAIDTLLQSLDMLVKRIEAGLTVEPKPVNNIHPFT